MSYAFIEPMARLFAPNNPGPEMVNYAPPRYETSTLDGMVRAPAAGGVTLNRAQPVYPMTGM